MREVRVTGQLVCTTAEEALVVRTHLPRHVELTHAEPGCISFAVAPTDDPWTWSIEERFRDRWSFARHQERVARSEWGRATAGIERRWSVEEADR